MGIYNPEDGTLYRHRRKDLKSYTIYTVFELELNIYV
jgi:hypothetical protein